ncbi:MAG: phenylacetic acid degradation protein [Chloroflexota bacterium]|nr:MAG: phenylacetic acid degradation protein [Chloroflexota bacterium]
MTDTQWRRYQVFVQEKSGEPHQDVGSVHAPDPELALFNARDVFARRPECVSMWVVPAEAIFSKTAQELAQWDPVKEPQSFGEAHPETYVVTCKQKQGGTQLQAGMVEAANPVEAMRSGIEKFGGKNPGLAWWVFPARLVIQSEPGDVESMFNPALDKPFRLSADFHTVSAMRKIKSGEQKPAQADELSRSDDSCAI